MAADCCVFKFHWRREDGTYLMRFHILVPIALFASLSRLGPWYENKRRIREAKRAMGTRMAFSE